MLMGRAALRWTRLVAISALGIGSAAAATVNAAAAATVNAAAGTINAAVAPVNVIPLPAQIESRDGGFAIGAGTRLAIPADPRAARVARYFVDLMQKTRGIKLETVSGASGAVVFRLGPPDGKSNPEAYTLDISSDRAVLSA